MKKYKWVVVIIIGLLISLSFFIIYWRNLQVRSRAAGDTWDFRFEGSESIQPNATDYTVQIRISPPTGKKIRVVNLVFSYPSSLFSGLGDNPITFNDPFRQLSVIQSGILNGTNQIRIAAESLMDNNGVLPNQSSLIASVKFIVKQGLQDGVQDKFEFVRYELIDDSSQKVGTNVSSEDFTVSVGSAGGTASPAPNTLTPTRDSAVSECNSIDLNRQECEALYRIWLGLNGPQWQYQTIQDVIITPWFSNNNPGTWQGISPIDTGQNKSIKEITLSRTYVKNIRGSINAADLNALSNLEIFDITGNEGVGSSLHENVLLGPNVLSGFSTHPNLKRLSLIGVLEEDNRIPVFAVNLNDLQLMYNYKTQGSSNVPVLFCYENQEAKNRVLQLPHHAITGYSSWEEIPICSTSNNPTPTSTPTPTRRSGNNPTSTPTSTPTPTRRSGNNPTSTPTRVLTPTSGEQTQLALVKLKLRFQGIQSRPQDYNNMEVKITFQSSENNSLKYSSNATVFTSDENGVWSGEVRVPIGQGGIPAGSTYKVYVKGPKHIQKRICDERPLETYPGTYSCLSGQIRLFVGTVDLDLSHIILLAGDLPDQDGIVNAADLARVYNILNLLEDQRRSYENRRIADINLDGIVNTIDYSLIQGALSIRSDEN